MYVNLKNNENFMNYRNVCSVHYIPLKSLSYPGECKATADYI